jgi:hypothetical protein
VIDKKDEKQYEIDIEMLEGSLSKSTLYEMEI